MGKQGWIYLKYACLGTDWMKFSKYLTERIISGKGRFKGLDEGMKILQTTFENKARLQSSLPWGSLSGKTIILQLDFGKCPFIIVSQTGKVKILVKNLVIQFFSKWVGVQLLEALENFL